VLPHSTLSARQYKAAVPVLFPRGAALRQLLSAASALLLALAGTSRHTGYF
jgi:hypothetical protein